MKQDQLNEIRDQCIEEVKHRYPGEDKVVVFGDGNPDADIVLVGEAPGEKETKYVRPFVGQAGKNLDEFLDVLQLKREEIYITNTVKFRPFKINPKTGRLLNRPPSKEEVNVCLPFLLKQFEEIKPELVVTLGNISLRAIAGDDKIAIGECHGSPFKMPNFYIFPLYHPASIIYNTSLKEVYYGDLLKLKEFIGNI